MQSQPIHLDRWRKRVHLMHDLQALHNFDEFHAHLRTDDWNVMGSKKTSGTRLVDVIHQPRYRFGGARALATYSPVGCRDQVRDLGGSELSWQDLDASNRLPIYENGLVVCAVFYHLTLIRRNRFGTD